MFLNRQSDGPAMALSPTQEHAFAQFPSQSILDSPNTFHGFPTNTTSIFGANQAQQPISSSGFAAQPAAPIPSRKRSRDEASFGEALAAPPAPAPAVAPAPKVEPIYGEGMVLLNPQTGMAISAESQTGTWYEEKAESQATSAPIASSAPQSDAVDISRKSQRLDVSAPGLDDIAYSSIQTRLDGPQADQHRTLTSGSTPPAEPLIDDATRLLGISWQRIDTDDDMAPAVRGWTKYIDNQYAAYLRDSQMLMKSRALNAYLVAATPLSSMVPAFYLFNEDLTQAQLVAFSWEACLHNLRNTPIMFEGALPIAAASRSNSPQSANPFTTTGDTGVPLLQQAISSHINASSSPDTGVGLSGSVEMGMEIDS
ncbi:hypothetical protein N7478_009794 [Penicillium angulare]|uniref:uncharacterized protein n=1 Tax=Penicillium angulare TaxID=116970 RepID=UPI00253F8DA9|nr:uncharacterized protein N7478_009794 [Penicillium angulare]KAJ5266986.1 hypothetical protein N7478_009794 [Penicillium angulare]